MQRLIVEMALVALYQLDKLVYQAAHVFLYLFYSEVFVVVMGSLLAASKE